MQYYLDEQITNTPHDHSLCVEIINKETFIKQYHHEHHVEYLIRQINNVAFCKIELFYDAMCGALVIPDRQELTKKHYFSFYLTKQKLVFIDEENYVSPLIEEMKETYNGKHRSLSKFLHDLIFLMTIDDGIFLQEYAKRLQIIEDELAFDFNNQINSEIMNLRKELLILNAYYHQLSDMVDILSENESDFLTDYECHIFRMQARRFDRLNNQLTELKDYSLQVKEMYQSKIDAHQNNVMTVLTIVTTIFFPLSIITSWYGMNFKNMPELINPYGYLIVIIVSVLVVICEIIILKKKKFF